MILKSEEYAGHKIWFEKLYPSHLVIAKVSLNGTWETVEGDTKKEAFHKMKLYLAAGKLYNHGKTR